MKAAALRYGSALIVAFGMAVPSWGAELKASDEDRVFVNFTHEAATVGHMTLRLEARGTTLEDDENTKLDLIGFRLEEVERRTGNTVDRIQGGKIEVLGSFGLWDNIESGFLMPFIVQRIGFADADDERDEDVGDLLLYTKFTHKVPDISEHLTVGGGVELTVPTGIERKRMGTGELGTNPFMALRYTWGKAAYGMHVGYFVYSGNVPNVFNYSVTATYRLNETYGLRAEMLGRLYKDGNAQVHDAMAMPGFDFYLTESLVIRPTGLANLTDEALDWGLALGVAYTL